MATNLQLDDRLIRKAVKLGGHRTKKDAVTQVPTNYIRHLEQAKILSLFGRVDFDSDYDYKRQRAKGRESSWIRGNGRQPIRTKAANSSTVAVPKLEPQMNADSRILRIEFFLIGAHPRSSAVAIRL